MKRHRNIVKFRFRPDQFKRFLICVETIEIEYRMETAFNSEYSYRLKVKVKWTTARTKQWVQSQHLKKLIILHIVTNYIIYLLTFWDKTDPQPSTPNTGKIEIESEPSINGNCSIDECFLCVCPKSQIALIDLCRLSQSTHLPQRNHGPKSKCLRPKWKENNSNRNCY